VHREGVADGRIERAVQPAQANAVVIVVESQLALTAVEKGFAAVGTHGAQIQREPQVSGQRGRGRR
jgi:hypothetical protein